MTLTDATTPQATILIVDDQEQNLQVVGTVLAMMAHEITPASSGAQAFKRLATHAPDLILLDVLMPEMDGLEVCRQIKADPRWEQVPVIFLSAADDKNLIVQALECGGVDYVTKPFNKAELVTRVRTHLALKQARDQLSALAEDKDELLGIITHDLANHLAGTQMSTTLLQGCLAEMPQKCRPLVDNIAHSTSRMLTCVQEFLANQSAERLQVRPAPLNLKTMVEQAAARNAETAAAKKTTLQLDLPDHDVLAIADHEAVAQVLDNLITNAVKFSPEGTKITLSASNSMLEWSQLIVQDEGPGFTEEDQSKLFRRYGRLSARPTGGEPSTGLGLSIVKRLVETMNGRIQLDSEPGKGACFTVRLPAMPAEEPLPAPVA